MKTSDAIPIAELCIVATFKRHVSKVQSPLGALSQHVGRAKPRNARFAHYERNFVSMYSILCYDASHYPIN